MTQVTGFIQLQIRGDSTWQRIRYPGQEEQWPPYSVNAATVTSIGPVKPGDTIEWTNKTSSPITIAVSAVNGYYPLTVNSFTIAPGEDIYEHWGPEYPGWRLPLRPEREGRRKDHRRELRITDSEPKRRIAANAAAILPCQGGANGRSFDTSCAGQKPPERAVVWRHKLPRVVFQIGTLVASSSHFG